MADDFQHYLEDTGVLDTLTTLLVSMYDDKDGIRSQADAAKAIAAKLALINDRTDDVNLLKAEIEKLKADKQLALQKIASLEEAIRDLQAQLHPPR